MNTALRKLLVASGFTVSILTLGACRDETESTADVLAQDSTLNLAVMSANQDTASPVETDTLAVAPPPAAPASEPIASPARTSATIQPAAIPRDRVAAATQATVIPRSRRNAVSGSSPRSRRVHSQVATANTPRKTAATRTASSRSDELVSSTSRGPVTPSARLRSSALIPVGSDLSFETDQRICTGSTMVGERFSARLAEDVVGPIGVVIPKGTLATATISSVQDRKGKNGESDAGIRIESLTMGGRTYQVSSDVTYTELSKVRTRSGAKAGKVLAGAGIGAIVGQVGGRNAKSTIIGAAGGAVAGAVVGSRSARTEECVPNGGRIIARLTEPLRVTLSE